MDQDTKSNIIAGFCIFLIFAAIAVACFFIRMGNEKFECIKYEEANNVKTKMVYGACYVPSANGYVPMSKIRGVE